MVKLTKYILLACIVLTQQACVKDLQDDINDGGWNHERTILDIQFENQMGTVDAATGDINLAINVDAVPDLSNIRLKKLQLSYQAEASLEVGDALNFENGSRSASITVTSATGETRNYTITVSEFTETLVGTWDVKKLTIYGGTGPEYGGGAVMQLTD